MKKALLLIAAVMIANAAALSPAAAAETAGLLPAAAEKAGQSFAADYRPERRATRVAHRLNYPYYRGIASGADPWWPGSGPRCSYGSYVACVYTNTACWQRCY
jgi:hypothetical protein